MTIEHNETSLSHNAQSRLEKREVYTPGIEERHFTAAFSKQYEGWHLAHNSISRGESTTDEEDGSKARELFLDTARVKAGDSVTVREEKMKKAIDLLLRGGRSDYFLLVAGALFESTEESDSRVIHSPEVAAMVTDYIIRILDYPSFNKTLQREIFDMLGKFKVDRTRLMAPEVVQRVQRLPKDDKSWGLLRRLWDM